MNFRIPDQLQERATQLYGAYLDSDPGQFVCGVETPAGRALTTAQTVVIELAIKPETYQPTADEAVASLVIQEAMKNGHVDLSDIVGI